MKSSLLIISFFSVALGFSQTIAPCVSAENVCAQNGTTFPLNQNSSPTGIPPGLSVSNPTNGSIPGGSGSGCLFSNGTYPNWFVINVGVSGNLEFTIGQAGGNGFYDWALWPYNTSNPTASCNAIFNNQVAPVACNWNGSSSGFTGMWNGGIPPGGNASNFVPSIPATAGQAFILLFSNYSGLSGSSNLSFPNNPGSAGISCSPGTPDYTICQGNSANVTIAAPQPITSANWLVTTGVSNTSGFVNVSVSPTTTTQYIVAVNMSGTIVNDTFMVNVVPALSPNAGPDQTVCLGQPFQLTGTVSSPTNTANWQAIVPTGMTPAATASFSPSFSSMNPSVTVNQPGTYRFVLRETNSVCGTVRDTVTVVVSQLQVATTTTNPICNGSSDGTITITSVGASEYSFDNGVSWQASNTQGGFAAGTYTVCARNTLGCQKCAIATLTDPPLIVMTVSNDTIICQNGTATLSAMASGGIGSATYSYHWDHNPALVESVQVSPLVDTYYPVQAESNLGCWSNKDSIYVTMNPVLAATMSADAFTCPGYEDSLTVFASGGIGAPYTITWNTGQTDVGTQSTLNDSPLVTTTYTVTIEDVCESTPVTISGVINAYPVPIPRISIDENPLCEPAVFVLRNTSLLSQNTVWRISNGDEFMNVDSLSTSETMHGTYDVQLIVTSPDGCIDSTTFTDTLVVMQTPVADFKWSPDPITMFNTQVLFTDYSLYADTYEWSFPGATPNNSTNDDQTVLYPDGETGTYYVTLVATSYLGCADTVTKEVVVMPEVIIYAPNAFTPDGDEFNQTWRVYIEGIDEFDFELQIFNRWGEVIWESHDVNAAWDGTYNGSPVPVGSYTWLINAKELISDKKYVWNGHIFLNK